MGLMIAILISMSLGFVAGVLVTKKNDSTISADASAAEKVVDDIKKV